MINAIKFSHDYEKLPRDWPGTQARLMAVVKVDMREYKQGLPAFVRYDTAFRGAPGRYELGDGAHLILFFIHYNTGLPFTTIRRATPEKEEYYRSLVGQTFVLVQVAQ